MKDKLVIILAVLLFIAICFIFILYKHSCSVEELNDNLNTSLQQEQAKLDLLQKQYTKLNEDFAKANEEKAKEINDVKEATDDELVIKFNNGLLLIQNESL